MSVSASSSGVTASVAPAAVAAVVTVTVETPFATEAVYSVVPAAKAGESVTSVPSVSLRDSALSVVSAGASVLPVIEGQTLSSPSVVMQTGDRVARGIAREDATDLILAGPGVTFLVFVVLVVGLHDPAAQRNVLGYPKWSVQPP